MKDLLTIITSNHVMVTLFLYDENAQVKDFEIRVAHEGSCIHFPVMRILTEKAPIKATMELASRVTVIQGHIYIGERWLDKPRPQNLIKKPRKT